MRLLWYLGMLPAAPLFATVQIVSVTSSLPSPQPIGTAIQWTVAATDSNPGPLTFRFNAGPANKPPALARDFNAGTISGGTWAPEPFVWVHTGAEGGYQVQVVAKDFTSGESDSRTIRFVVTPLATGNRPVVAATANPLVALFSAPACAAGSSMRVSFKQQSAESPVSETNWAPCRAGATMTFEIAGMYPSTTYQMHAQTRTGGTITHGPSVGFTTGPLPTSIAFPGLKVIVPEGPLTDTAEPVLLWGLSQLGMETNWRDEATDLAGNVMWYYAANSQQPDLLTRPLAGGGMLTIQDDAAWNPATRNGQVLRQIDLAGNITRETNTGIIQQQLLALGAADGGPCTGIPQPAPVGAACLGGFHHEAMELPDGDVAVLASIEKIFPAGTQGDSSGLPVDIVGDMIIVLNTDWQAVWYFDAFEYLDVNRPAVLGETCATGQAGCPPILLLGAGIAPLAKDWLHANSIYYSPQNGDLIWSCKDQDWVMKVDYNNGAGTGELLWRMGPDGDFTFDNVADDRWPWFSHQHDVSIANNGAGPMLLFDNGDTRIAPPPVGLGVPGCEPSDCHSRGMALNFDETTMMVSPVFSVDLGVYSPADGAAQTLGNGDYFFFAPLVYGGGNVRSYAIEISGSGQVLNIQGPEGYRAWRMPSLYSLN